MNTNIKYFACQATDKQLLSKASSGGIFSLLANYVLDNNGVVFGAAWTVDFKKVTIIKVETKAELQPILGSKYLKADTSNSFEECKKYLDAGRLVLYSSLPCQIWALKNYLKHGYKNLICVDICCHGTMPNLIWLDYLGSIQRPNHKILNINMRDKRLGWNNYGISIKYDDGIEIFKKAKSHKYMKALLSDKYLNKSCYNCKFKNEHSSADLAIGDFWAYKDIPLNIDYKLGISVVICYSDVGLEVFNNIKCYKKEINEIIAKKKNGGMWNKIITLPEPYNNSIFYKDNKIALLTLNFNDNIGGVLQNYALQEFLKDNNYKTTTIQTREYKHHLNFVNEKINLKVVKDFKNLYGLYNYYIVGSDQVWRKEYIVKPKKKEDYRNFFFLKFAETWKVKKIGYSISWGTPSFDVFDNSLIKYINLFDKLSCRELSGSNTLEKITKKSITTTCDPAFLLTKDTYLDLCKVIPVKKGFFSYILDMNIDKKNFIDNLNAPKINVDKLNVEEFLAAYRDAKFIITDSYHGCVFSLIFNKPFICFYNKERGNSRFDTLIKVFNIGDRFINDFSEAIKSAKLLHTAPNVDYSEFVNNSKKYLLEGLANE